MSNGATHEVVETRMPSGGSRPLRAVPKRRRRGLTPAQSDALIAEVQAIERHASAAMARIARGEAPNGTSSLATIRNKAADAARWGVIHLERNNATPTPFPD